MGVASPPASRISRATVEMVEAGELGSGGKGEALDASEVDFAATTTESLASPLVSVLGWLYLHHGCFLGSVR